MLESQPVEKRIPTLTIGGIQGHQVLSINTVTTTHLTHCTNDFQNWKSLGTTGFTKVDKNRRLSPKQLTLNTLNTPQDSSSLIQEIEAPTTSQSNKKYTRFTSTGFSPAFERRNGISDTRYLPLNIAKRRPRTAEPYYNSYFECNTTRFIDELKGVCVKSLTQYASEISALVVDKDNVMSSLVHKYLQSLSVSLVWVANGSIALQHLQAKKYDLVFCPVILSDMDVPLFLEKLKLYYKEPIPVFMLTSGGGHDTVTKMISCGALDCLKPPLTLDIFKAKIKWYLDSHWIRKQIHQIIQREEIRDIDAHLQQQHQNSLSSVQNDKSTKADAEKISSLLTELANTQKQLMKAESSIVELESKNSKLAEENFELRKNVDSLVWRMSWLESEKLKGERLTEELQEKYKEIEAMKKQVAQAWESPMQSLLRTVNSVASESPGKIYTGADLKLVLSNVLQTMSSADIYTPKFATIELDDMTKSWMIDQFSRSTAPPPPLYPKRSLSLKNLLDAKDTRISLPEEKKSEHLQLLQSMDIVVWDYTIDELALFVTLIFEDLGLLETFRIHPDQLHAFILLVNENYIQDNPYHNFQHAFDVTQTVYLLLKRSDATQCLTKVDILALVVGGLCHDLNHPGLNNGYQVAAGTRLARLYNDKSVLENHHAARAFELLESDDSVNILKRLSPTEFREFRKAFIAAVLATDMTVHFEVTTKFTARLETGKAFSVDEPDDRQLLVNVILHSADISNVAKPYKISKQWSDRVYEEFLNQGDIEREKGMPISPYMDRNNSSQIKMTLGFIGNVPLLSVAINCLKNFAEGTQEFLQNIITNRAIWAATPPEESVIPKPSGHWQKLRAKLREAKANNVKKPAILDLSELLLNSIREEKKTPKSFKKKTLDHPSFAKLREKQRTTLKTVE